MTFRTSLAALAAAIVLAGCGTTGTLSPQPRAAATLAARGDAAKADDRREPAKLDRPAPPTTGDQAKPKQGMAARQSVRSAERALYRYADMLRQWERARTDAEKDRIEQDMLVELHSTLDDIVQVTSQQGHDRADREAYDLAAHSLDRYDRLYREWDLARTDEEKRRILNEMLTDMVRALNSIKRVA